MLGGPLGSFFLSAGFGAEDCSNCPVVWSVWSDKILNPTNPFRGIFVICSQCNTYVCVCMHMYVCIYIYIYIYIHTYIHTYTHTYYISRRRPCDAGDQERGRGADGGAGAPVSTV